MMHEIETKNRIPTYIPSKYDSWNPFYFKNSGYHIFMERYLTGFAFSFKNISFISFPEKHT
jgi:hypothetical protein